MCDQDDRQSLGSQVREVRQQRSAFLGCQHSRRFVQDQKTGPAIQGFGDLDPLSLGYGKILHFLPWIEIQAKLGAQVRDAPLGFLAS